MKKQLYIVIGLTFTFASFGQFGNVGKTTSNAEGSNYKFKKVAHLDATPVQSQGITGTCWSFSALSFFESELMRMGMKNPPILAEMYIARKAYEAKAEKYLRMDGKINFAEGGAFHDIPYVIKNYGIVPEEIYSGLNGAEFHDHRELFSVLNGSMEGLMKYRNSKKAVVNSTWKTAIYGILDAYLGEDVKEFEYEGKKYTPMSYAKELGLNMDDYVSLTSFSNHPFYQKCHLAIPDNWAWGESYNVELQDMMDVVEYALKEGYTLAWGADVTEKGFDFRKGLALVPKDPSDIVVKGKDNKNFSDAGAEKQSDIFLNPGEEVEVTQEMRQEAYDNKTTTDDHGMHIVGLYQDQNGTKYLLIKNSWGTDLNLQEGYMYISESYFKLKTINIYLHKDGINKGLKKKLKI